MAINPLEQRLAQYYDQDASARAGRTLEPERVRRRSDFIEALKAEQRSRVLDVGVGTGTDAVAFAQAGLGVTGVDLAAEHVAYCRRVGVAAEVGSVLDLPFDTDSFDAAWSMSTFMHIPDGDIATAFSEMRRVLVAGAPMAVGCWGGSGFEGTYSKDTIEPRRYFNFRMDETWRSLLSRHAELVLFDSWQVGDDPSHHYQWAIVRFA